MTERNLKNNLSYFEEHIVTNIFSYVLFFTFLSLIAAVIHCQQPILRVLFFTLSISTFGLAVKVFLGHRTRLRIFHTMVRRFERNGLVLSDFKGKCGEPCLWVQNYFILRRFGRQNDWVHIMKLYSFINYGYIIHHDDTVEEIVNYGGDIDFNITDCLIDSKITYPPKKSS